MSNDNPQKRTLGLFQASVLNMIDMVGIGPFITLPFVIGLLGGMYLWAWVAGAVLSIVDAMVWSELGAAYPLAGGSYNFLKVSYGEKGAGKLMSFLYVWQTIIQAPLVAASAAIGFADYIIYLLPNLTHTDQKIISGYVIILVTTLLYRKIDSIGKIGVLLWAGVVATLSWIIFAGVTHGNFLHPIADATNSFSFKAIASFVFGQACVKTIYSYLGYYNVCHLGGEIKNPEKNIPKSMIISIIVIAILYLAMNMSITSVIPWQEIQAWKGTNNEKYVISIFIDRLYGHKASIVITVMILWVALASLFAVMLGYSRVPYAAAKDGAFFKIFAKEHPTKKFPYISLLILAAFAFCFSLLFKMKDVISGILAMRIMVQFIGQAIGLIILRNRKAANEMPFKMPLYPVPIALAILRWLFVFSATGSAVIISFVAVLGSGLIVYFTKAKINREWPFAADEKLLEEIDEMKTI